MCLRRFLCSIISVIAIKDAFHERDDTQMIRHCSTQGWEPKLVKISYRTLLTDTGVASGLKLVCASSGARPTRYGVRVTFGPVVDAAGHNAGVGGARYGVLVDGGAGR